MRGGCYHKSVPYIFTTLGEILSFLSKTMEKIKKEIEKGFFPHNCAGNVG
jgi:hypothetical protein